MEELTGDIRAPETLETFYETVVLPKFDVELTGTLEWQGHDKLGPDSFAHYFKDTGDNNLYMLGFDDYPTYDWQGEFASATQIGVKDGEGDEREKYVHVTREDNLYIENMTGHFVLFRGEHRALPDDPIDAAVYSLYRDISQAIEQQNVDTLRELDTKVGQLIAQDDEYEHTYLYELQELVQAMYEIVSGRLPKDRSVDDRQLAELVRAFRIAIPNLPSIETLIFRALTDEVEIIITQNSMRSRVSRAEAIARLVSTEIAKYEKLVLLQNGILYDVADDAWLVAAEPTDEHWRSLLESVKIMTEPLNP